MIQLETLAALSRIKYIAQASFSKGCFRGHNDKS